MQFIAREAGVSQSTVSLALRNDPRISAETKTRVQDLATRHGYRPDPALSALIAYRARTRSRRDYGKIAVLHDMDQEENHFALALRQQLNGIREKAARLGQDIELIRVYPEEKLSMQLGRRLYARGIRGIILLSLRMAELRMQWDHFSTVVIGEYFSEPPHNHVNHHHSAVLTITYQELRKLGYRKIGFCNSRISEERKHHLYLGAYLKCLHLDGLSPKSLPPFLYDDFPEWSPLPWLDRHRFDAVMSMVPSVFMEKLKKSAYSVPTNLGLAGYSIPANDPVSPFSGCVLDYHRMGTAAVELLETMIHNGQRGVPAEIERYDVLIRGAWHAGSTTRQAQGLARLAD